MHPVDVCFSTGDHHVSHHTAAVVEPSVKSFLTNVVTQVFGVVLTSSTNNVSSSTVQEQPNSTTSVAHFEADSFISIHSHSYQRHTSYKNLNNSHDSEDIGSPNTSIEYENLTAAHADAARAHAWSPYSHAHPYLLQICPHLYVPWYVTL